MLEKSQIVKFEIMKSYPYLFRFVLKAYFEKHADIAEKLAGQNKDIIAKNAEAVLSKIDTFKFKDGIDVRQVLNIIIWCSDRYLKEKIITIHWIWINLTKSF